MKGSQLCPAISGGLEAAYILKNCFEWQRELQASEDDCFFNRIPPFQLPHLAALKTFASLVYFDKL